MKENEKKNPSWSTVSNHFVSARLIVGFDDFKNSFIPMYWQ